MEKKPARVVRRDEIERSVRSFSQRMNPRSLIRGAWLGSLGGLSRIGVDLVRLPPGKESFTYHAHLVEEEWLYALAGRAVVRADGAETEIGPGDFVAFPTPQVAHVLKNPFAEEFVYLQGGEHSGMDVIEYPDSGKKYLLLSRPGQPAAFHELGPESHPFGPAEGAAGAQGE